MADLTRERLAWIKKHLFPPTGMTPDEWRQLCSMAERSVSEETMRILVRALESENWAVFLDFGVSAKDDLRPAAEALAKGTK